MAKTALRLQRERQRAIRNQIIITDPSKCFVCRSTGLTEAEKFCPNCGFPQRGNKDEMKRFIYVLNNKKQILEEHKKKIQKATTTLYVLGGIHVLFGILMGFVLEKSMPMVIYCSIVAAIYVSLGVWSKKNPFAAILSGFFVYITLIVISAVSDPSTLVNGIFWKAFIITAFVYGYKAVKDAKAMEVELASTQKARDLNMENFDIETANQTA